ncbi:MAG TPA: hypothetical protein VGX48_12150 [Pyrinomonadaceae bacterium]|jgi:hypothetical protein|nr:hypothetical protein [Pyrinomonadaceae bacterium]
MALREPASRPGARVAEPDGGGLSRVHILREALLIDLRPLRVGRPALVDATYRVRNDGEARDVELVFVAAGLAPRGEAGGWVWRRRDWVREASVESKAESGVWLDGRPVPASESSGEVFAKAWETPPETPGFAERGGGPLPYKAEGEGASINFRLSLAPGEHEIRVRYEARPSAYCDINSDAVYWQLGYVLAPAREWASFGGLDAKVLFPAGWRVASSPEMRREGDALVASWDALPADSLAVTAQTDGRTVYNSGTFWMALIILGALFSLFAGYAGWRVGRRLGAQGRTGVWALVFSPALALLLCLLASLVATIVSAPTAPDQIAFNRIGGYDFIVTFFLLLVSFALHSVVTLTTALVARWRTTLK